MEEKEMYAATSDVIDAETEDDDDVEWIQGDEVEDLIDIVVGIARDFYL